MSAIIQYIQDHQIKLDAGTTINVNKALAYLRSKTYKKEFAKLKGRDIVPIDGTVPTGANSIITTTYEEVGEADIIADYATDAPTVDAKATMGASIVRGMQTKYNLSIQDVRAAAMTGSGLPEKKASAAHKAIETLHDNIMLLGSAGWGFFGLFTIPNALVYTVPNGASGSTLWTSKTPLEILEDMHAMDAYGPDATNEVESPTHLVLPDDRYRLIAMMPMGLGYAGTILEEFLRTSINIKTVISSVKLKSNPGWTGRRMVAFDKDPDKVAYVIPQEFEQLPPQVLGLNTWTYCHSRTGGTVSEAPKSITYGNNI